MAFELNNLAAPYNALAYITVWYSAADYQADVANGFNPATKHWVSGSGVLIGNNDVLTAAHVVYDMLNNRTPWKIQVTFGYDPYEPSKGGAETPYGSFNVTEVATFNDVVDPDHNGYFLPGDNKAASLGGSELDVAVLQIWPDRTSSLPAPMAWSGAAFTGAKLEINGYPGDYGLNPTGQSVAVRNTIDNYLSMSPTQSLGPGSSGGPAWSYVSGTPTVHGVISSTGALTELAAHADWIRQYTKMNDVNVVGSAANDIFRPHKMELWSQQPDGFMIAPPREYGFGSSIAGGNIDGGSGIDTIALPWHSTTFDYTAGIQQRTASTVPGVPVKTDTTIAWTKDANGKITGILQSGSNITTFENIEKIAFSNTVFNLAAIAVVPGEVYGIGPLVGSMTSTGGGGGIPWTAMGKPVHAVSGSGQVVARNAIGLQIQSYAGDDAPNVIVGTNKADDIFGLGGADRLTGGLGDDWISGGAGNDVLDGGAGAALRTGGSDTVDYSYLTAGQNITVKLGAFAAATGAVGVTSTSGVAGDVDRISNFENIVGGNGNDTLTGNAGSNRIEGGAGDDVIDGGRGNDVLIGGDNGARGDTVSFASFTGGVTASLAAGYATMFPNSLSPEFQTLSGFENITGSKKNDTLTGDAFNNVIEGGLGRDILTGGLGRDTFRFNKLNEGVDTITDFVSGEDLIAISKAGFGLKSAIDLGAAGNFDFAAHYFTSNAAGVGSEFGHGQFVFNETTDQLLWDADGAGKRKGVVIAQFSNDAQLHAYDFDLI